MPIAGSFKPVAITKFLSPTQIALQINWAMNNKQEFIDIVETVYRGARKGRGLVVSPKGRTCAAGSILHPQGSCCLPKLLEMAAALLSHMCGSSLLHAFDIVAGLADYSTKYRY